MTLNEFEQHELYEFIEFAQNTSIDGIEIDGFKEIYELITEEINNSLITKERILELINQLQLVRDFFEALSCSDLDLFEKVLEILNEKAK